MDFGFVSRLREHQCGLSQLGMLLNFHSLVSIHGQTG